MNILQGYLDAREKRTADQADADRRWMLERGGVDAGERLLKWDGWVKGQLLTLLIWPEAESARERLLGQCAAELTVMAKQLRGRGWLLDGEALAVHVRAVLEPIGKAQRAGTVLDFWPYYRASVGRYVGANAEEIQAQARRSGCDDAQAVGDLLAGFVGRIRRETMTELLATRAAEVTSAKASLRAKQAAARAKQASCTAAAPELPGLF